jgi:hypothetical protein
MLTSSNIEHRSHNDLHRCSIRGKTILPKSSNISKCYQYNSSRGYLYSVPNNSLFFRAKIRSNVDLSEDEYYKQKFVTIRVKNTGHNTLHNCQAELSVLRLRDQCPSECPLDDPKLLCWGRYPKSDDLTPERNIQADGSQILHVVFSDSDFDNIQVSDGSKRYACVSTPECMNGNRDKVQAPYLPQEDSFANGEFIIRISITSEEGISKNQLFLLHIDTDYKKIGMMKLSLRSRIWRRLGLLRKNMLTVGPR